jgi:hypothetical protein
MAVEARRRRGSKSVNEEDFFKDGIQKLVKCWQKCFVVRGDMWKMIMHSCK